MGSWECKGELELTGLLKPEHYMVETVCIKLFLVHAAGV